jgi:hypothetical protein
MFDKNIIRIMAGSRVVGRYVIVTGKHIPIGLTHSAKNINDGMRWFKHREKENSDLTEEEHKALTFQILKSETW